MNEQQTKELNELEMLQQELVDQKKKIELLQQKKMLDAQMQAINYVGEEPKKSKVKQDEPFTMPVNGEVVSKKLAAIDLQNQLRRTRVFIFTYIALGLILVAFARYSMMMGVAFYFVMFIVLVVELVLDIKKESYLVQKYDLPIKAIVGKGKKKN